MVTYPARSAAVRATDAWRSNVVVVAAGCNNWLASFRLSVCGIVPVAVT